MALKKKISWYMYSKNIMNDTFRIDIKIDAEGKVKGQIYDLSFEDEYTNFRLEDSTGSFVGQVKDEFIKLLTDIKNKCFINVAFLSEQSNRIAKAIKEKYGDEPNFEWEKFPRYATFRNRDNKKWYGIIMNVDKSKLEAGSSGEMEIIDIKLDPNEIKELLQCTGFYPAYHMNKKSWITMALNDTICDEKIMELIAKSYSYTVAGSSNVNNVWIIPANPQYFDIEKSLKNSKTMIWKQRANIQKNDIVYLYVAEPVSSIMYKFKVDDVNISYDYHDENIKMHKAMRITLITRYAKGTLSLAKLKEFGVTAVRSQRHMSLNLSEYIDKMSSK